MTWNQIKYLNDNLKNDSSYCTLQCSMNVFQIFCMCLQTPPGSVFLRGPGCLGSLASCLRIVLYFLCLCLKQDLHPRVHPWASHSQEWDQGSCAAPLGPHIHSDRFFPSLVLCSSRSLISQGLYPSEAGLCPFLGMGPKFPNDFWHWRWALITFQCLEFWLLHLAHLGTNTIVNKLVKIQITHIKLIQHSVKIPQAHSTHCIRFKLGFAARALWGGCQLYPNPAELGDPLFAQALSPLPQLHPNSSTHLSPPLKIRHTEHGKHLGLVCFW